VTKADNILGYRDPASKEITFCGEQVLVTAPTAEVTPELMKAVNGIAGAGEALKNRSVLDLAMPLMHCVPEVAIYCLRDPDTFEPIFPTDTEEVRGRLKRVPAAEGIKLLATCMELFNTRV
jgi:hypothetical protein